MCCKDTPCQGEAVVEISATDVLEAINKAEREYYSSDLSSGSAAVAAFEQLRNEVHELALRAKT